MNKNTSFEISKKQRVFKTHAPDVLIVTLHRLCFIVVVLVCFVVLGGGFSSGTQPLALCRQSVLALRRPQTDTAIGHI